MYVMHVVCVVGEDTCGELVEPCRNTTSKRGSNIGWDFTEVLAKVLLNSVLVPSNRAILGERGYNIKHKRTL